MKLHLKTKIFREMTEDAFRMQISVAIITHCFKAIAQHNMQLKRSTDKTLQILSISLTDKTHLLNLFDKISFNDAKNHFDLLILIPGLFDSFKFVPIIIGY
jgi:hypothetical protein